LKQIVRNNPKKIVDIFVQYILKYKQQIDSGDENFFMSKTYDNEIDDDMINKVFEFKTLWKQLNDDNKGVVIQYMQCLCQLSLNYVNDMVRN
jgi:hypothetical protein